MKTQKINLFIVDDDNLMVNALKQYLENKFGANINITTFNDGESCLKEINKELNIVILDYFMEGKNGLEILKSIKSINPKTEVIMLSGNEDITMAIESFRAGAKDYLVKGFDSWERVTKLLSHIILAPIQFIVKGFSTALLPR